MRLSKETQLEHIGWIRRILVMDSSVSLIRIQRIIEESYGRKMAIDYIWRLLKKVRGERIKRFENITLTKFLAKFADILTESDKKLWLIANGKDNSEKDRIAALREIRNNNRDLFDKMFDSGIFEKKLGELGVKFPLAEMLAELNDLTGNQFNWQKNKGLDKFKSNVERKPIAGSKGDGHEADKSPEELP